MGRGHDDDDLVVVVSCVGIIIESLGVELGVIESLTISAHAHTQPYTIRYRSCDTYMIGVRVSWSHTTIPIGAPFVLNRFSRRV